MAKRSVIVGAQGQDGRCLSEYLSGLGHQCLGISRGEGLDISNPSAVRKVLREFKPDEVYFLAAYHHSSDEKAESEFDLWEKSFSTHALGPEIFLESIRLEAPNTRFFYASSSLVFGDQAGELDERATLMPMNPYAFTKVAGMGVCEYYEKNYGIFASVGILFNHESEYRGARFLTKKIVRAVAEAQRGEGRGLELGDLSAQTDWGYARDYVRAMSAILNLKDPGRFVISSGTLHTVQDFVSLAFSKAGLDYRNYVTENPARLLRRIPARFGNPKKLKELTGWFPTTSFDGLIEIMLKSEGVHLV